VNFYRNWTDYASGFGSLTEFWLGDILVSNSIPTHLQFIGFKCFAVNALSLSSFKKLLKSCSLDRFVTLG